MGQTRKYWWTAAVCAVLAAVAVFAVARRPALSAVITVGVDHSPPFYSIQADGSVRGLAVDVLNEAARRRGIRLIWKPLQDIPLDDALARRAVQLWPLVGATEERRKMFYLSRPWLESDYILVSLQSHPIKDPAAASGQLVAHARLKFTTAVARKYLAGSRILIRRLRSEAIQSVCSGEAVASVVESRVFDGILLKRPEGCETAAFHISSLPGASTPLSIMAVPEVSATAEALRREIAGLASDGFLSATLDEWSPFSAEGTRSVWAQEEANKRSLIYAYLLVSIMALSLVLAWFAHRAWRLKKEAERAQRGEREIQKRFTAFMDNSPAIAFMKDVSGKMRYANPAWGRILGRSPDEWRDKDDFALFPAGTAAKMREADLATLKEGKARQVIQVIPVSPSETRAMLVVKFPFSGAAGEQFVGGMAIDVTERESALRELSASEARYRELFEQNPLSAWVYDRATLAFLAVNDAAVQRYGWSREDFLGGLTLTDLIVPDREDSDVRSGREGNAGSQREREVERMDEAHRVRRSWRHRTKENVLLSVEVTSYELEYGGREARLAIVVDTTEQERMLEQLRVSEERWQLALRGAGDALWDWDLVSGKVFRSPRWYAMLGYDETEIGNSPDDMLRLLHPDDTARTRLALQEHLARRTPSFSIEFRLRHKDGSWRWILDRGQAVWDDRGRPVRMAGAHSDITDRKVAEGLLALQARTDALTGLANRREFDRLFDERIRASRENHEPLTVCACDLDRFKSVNDTWGHAVGDQVLVAFAEMLRSGLRPADIAGRLGGDEFLLAFPRTTAEDARALVEDLRRRFEERVFEARGEPFHASCSFGIVQLRTWHRDAKDLIADADRYLYDAKELGRNQTLVAA